MAYSMPSSPDPFSQQEASWLSLLPSHPIFSVNDGSNTPRTSNQGAPAPAQMVLRGSDVIVLANEELRILSLSSLKHRATDASDASNAALSYKTLTSPLLKGAIRDSQKERPRLTLSPGKSLLVVSTATSLVLVVLPRSTALTSSAAHIPVKAHSVGSYYHNDRTPKQEYVVGTKWHPWSRRGSSLLVLLRDGTLFEYDVARDLQEPQQTISLLPRNSKTASPRLGFMGKAASMPWGSGSSQSRGSGYALDEELDSEDEHELQAVAFTLAISSSSAPVTADDATSTQVDWAPLTIYVLTRSGDLYAAAPFLPRYAHLPSSYLQSLSSFAQLSDESTSNVASKQREFALRFASNLLKQARNYQTSVTARSSERLGTPARSVRGSTPADVLRSSKSAMSVDPAPLEGDDAAEMDSEDDYAEVEAPRDPLVPPRLAPQGPFLLVPAPHELSETREALGSDVVYLRLPGAASGSSPPVDLELLMLGGDDGRVDVGILNVAGKVAPKWSSEKEQSLGKAREGLSSRADSRPPWMRGCSKRPRDLPRKAGHFGLSDSSSSSEDEPDASELDITGVEPATSSSHLPTLFLYESLDLGLPKPSLSSRSALRFTADSVYPENLYVNHAFGVHMISLQSWSKSFVALLSSGDIDGLQQFLQTGRESEARWVVKIQDAGKDAVNASERYGVSCVEVVDDVYLGYSMMALLGDGECLGLELSLTPSTAAASVPDISTRDVGKVNPEKPLYTSLLGTEAFVPPSPFNKSGPAFPAMRLKASDPSLSKKEIQVTPETLRLLGTTVQDLRSRVREVVQGGNAIQRRLELQMQELQRQISKVKDLHTRTERGHQSGHGGERIARVAARQRKLLQRVDRVLQKTMDESETGISQYEEAWLKEMETLERGVGVSDNEGLRGRVQKVSAAYCSAKTSNRWTDETCPCSFSHISYKRNWTSSNRP